MLSAQARLLRCTSHWTAFRKKLNKQRAERIEKANDRSLAEEAEAPRLTETPHLIFVGGAVHEEISPLTHFAGVEVRLDDDLQPQEIYVCSIDEASKASDGKTISDIREDADKAKAERYAVAQGDTDDDDDDEGTA